MAAIRQDVVQALRVLRKQPAFTTIALLMLAFGIGANVAIFSLVNAAVFRPLPFVDPDRLMMLHLMAPDRDAPGTYHPMVWSYPKYQVLREQQQIFDSTAIFVGWEWNLTGSGSPERITGELVEQTYFRALGVSPALGRTFSADETAAPNSPPLVVLNYGFWMRRFGGDSTVVGKTLGLNGTPHTILGVLPSGLSRVDGPGRSVRARHDPVRLGPRLKPGITRTVWSHGASRTCLWIRRRRPCRFSEVRSTPSTRPRGGKIDTRTRTCGRASAIPLNDQRIDPLIRRSVLLMLAAVAALLLIVCVNLANLMLVRGLARERELAIRLALGANRLRIVRQLMTESLLLATVGAIGGLAVAYGIVSGAAALMPDLRMVLPRQTITGDLTRVGLGHAGSRRLARSRLLRSPPWPPPCCSVSGLPGARLGASSRKP